MIEGDVVALAKLAPSFHAEAKNLRHVKFDMLTFLTFLERCLIKESHSQCWVIVKDGEIIGSFAGSLSPMIMAKEYVACDNWVYIAPEHRGTKMSFIILKEILGLFKQWARSKADIATFLLGVTTGVREEETIELFKALGATHYGSMVRVY